MCYQIIIICENKIVLLYFKIIERNLFIHEFLKTTILHLKNLNIANISKICMDTIYFGKSFLTENLAN